MDCTNCGAPLPPKSNVCTYCQTLNDTDLRGRRVERGPQGGRSCPRCRIEMRSLDLKLGAGLFIERCATCLGIFFDPGELDRVLEGAAAPAREVDLSRLDQIVREEANTDHAGSIAYLACPVCGSLMHRRAYGARSGVIADTCKEHGVWLDGGELRQLMKWTAAGGRLHADHRESERERERERQGRIPSGLDVQLARMDPQSAPARKSQEPGLLDVLSLFRRLLGGA
jgi:Zn-finger nucleic acid-binding protein